MHGEPVEVRGSGYFARCLQHETDHLRGVLYIDHLPRNRRRRLLREMQRFDWNAPSLAYTGQPSVGPSVQGRQLIPRVALGPPKALCAFPANTWKVLCARRSDPPLRGSQISTIRLPSRSEDPRPAQERGLGDAELPDASDASCDLVTCLTASCARPPAPARAEVVRFRSGFPRLVAGGGQARAANDLPYYSGQMSISRQQSIRATARSVCVRLGRRASFEQLTVLRSVLTYLEFGYWLRTLPVELRPDSLATDFDVFETARRNIIAKRFLYLEFGVYKGRSISWWLNNLDAPEARFVGFDSFQGLPEDWRPGLHAGFFKTGSPPAIDDTRLSFEVGWFKDTLPNFAIPDHDQLMINIDSDLYSSARTILAWAKPYLRPGSLIYFDEFTDRDHEMRAYFEFLAESGTEMTPLAMAQHGMHLLLKVM